MQKYIFNTFLFCIILCISTVAQNTLRIQSPARITTSGAVQVVYGGGNFTNNGTYTDAAGTFKAVGGTTFSGTGTTGFYNATFDHNTASSVFSSQVSVNNQTTITAGNVDAGALRLYLRSDLNPNANLINNGVLTGTVNGLLTKATVTSGATAYSSTLSLNISGTAQQYQWQSSTDNSNWSNIASATSATYNATVSSNTYFRCVLTTNNSAFSQNSPSILLAVDTPFKTTWKVANNNIIIPTFSSSGTYNYTVNYRKKGTTPFTTITNQTGNCTISGLTDGDTIQVEITGVFPHFYMNNNATEKDKLLSIDAWGNQNWKSMGNTFWGCSNLVYNASDIPDLSSVTNMSLMFFRCLKFNGNIGGWNTSNVTDMTRLFGNTTIFNQPIGSWNIDKVTSMFGMFASAAKFNQPLTNWNTSKVTDMADMFFFATDFNQDLSVLELDVVTPTRLVFMLNNSGLSAANYDATLTGWLSQNKTGVNLGASGLTYCNATAARTTLTTPIASGGKGWTITGDKGCTTTTLTSSQNPASSGSSVTFTATVSPNTATGTVTFQDGITTIGKGVLSAGQATFATTTLSTGTRSITAVYEGNTTNATSTSAVLSQVVTGCALTASPGNVNITWTGFQNRDWNNPCNWSPSWVPDVTNAKAIIPGSQEDQPIISGTVPDVNSIDINGGTLTINNGATLNIRENGGVNKGIRIDGGILINNGTINIESITNTAIYAYIYLASNDGGTSTFTNNGTVKINSTDEAIGVGNSKNSIIDNNATGIINVVNGIGIEVALPTDVMTFTNAGTINYNGSALALSLQGNTSFTNTGTININSGTGISQTSSVSLTNNGCGKILMSTGTYVNGGGTTLNRGLIQMPTAYDYTNTGTFTNNGIVRANTVSGITNNNVIISNTCPIFTVAGSTNYTINGIFTDAIATNQAGTYTSVGNLFIANNTLPSGSQTLYAKLSGGDCDNTVIVPFNFDNVLPTAVSINSTTICEGASVNLLATCASGTPIWYANATGGTALGTGASFSYSPPIIGANQSFYAACETTNCKSGRVSTSNTVTVNPNPTALASSNSPVCEGSTINLFSGNTEKIAITSGAEPSQTYAWTGVNSFTSNLQNPSIPSATVLANGTYQVTVSSFDGCTATATTLVTIKPSPVLNPSTNSPVCSGQTLFLYAKGENQSGTPSTDTYTWTGVNNFTANTQNPFIGNVGMNANGVYTVSAVSTTNCSATATVLVTIKETPTLVVSNFTNPTPENNPDGTISFTTNLPNASFSLSYGSTGSPKDVTVTNGAFILNGLVSGVYGNFAVTNDGCTGRNNTEVTLLSTPFTLVKSITTGNWEANTTWNVGRVPKAGDVVIIDGGHAVTINANSTIKDMEVRGQLIYGAVGIVINLGL